MFGHAPKFTVRGLPTITVIHPDGKEDQITIENVMLKPFVDLFLTGGASIAKGALGIVKVGSASDVVDATTSSIITPIKPGSNYTTNVTRTNPYTVTSISPDDKVKVAGFTYSSVFGVGAIVGQLREIGLDLQNRTTTPNVDFKVVLPAAITLDATMQLKVEYRIEVTITKPEPFQITVPTLTDPLQVTVTPVWQGLDANADCCDLGYLLSATSSLYFAATNRTERQTGRPPYVFSTVTLTQDVATCSVVSAYKAGPGLPASSGNAIGFIMSHGENSGIGYNFNPVIPRVLADETFYCELKREYYDISPWYTRPTPPEPGGKVSAALLSMAYTEDAVEPVTATFTVTAASRN